MRWLLLIIALISFTGYMIIGSERAKMAFSERFGGNNVQSITFEVTSSTRVIDDIIVYDTNPIKNEIIKQAKIYNVDVDTALRIAECESQFNPQATNKESSAKGVYQFIDGTWDWIEAPKSPFDYKENIKQFMIWYKIYPNWWEECL